MSILPFSTDAFLDKAMVQTGLSDWGEPAFKDGLEALISAFNQPGVSEAAARAEQKHMMNRLRQRLRVIEARKTNPDIAAQVIERPVFVLGMPRTGTTHLHRLMALDPRHRAPRLWEIFLPDPAPCPNETNDPRITQTDDLLREVGLTDDNIGAMHSINAMAHEECQYIFEYAFRCLNFAARSSVPDYAAWLEAQDYGPAYAIHKMVLQHLQSAAPHLRWVLKSPEHVMRIKALFKEYPDALVLHTHRHPGTVLASTLSIISKVQALSGAPADIESLRTMWLDNLGKGIDEVEDVRGEFGGQIHDVQFTDLVADPSRTLARVYEFIGTDYDAAARSRVEGYMADNPRHKLGKHRYELADFGLTQEDVEQRYARYIADHC